MKQWLAALSIALTMAAALGAREIKGSVFIVTQSGQAIKLALAEVYVITPLGREQMKVQQEQRENDVATAIARHEKTMQEDIQREEMDALAKEGNVLAAKRALEKFNTEVRAPLLAQWGAEPSLPAFGDIQSRERISSMWEKRTRFAEWDQLRRDLLVAEASVESARDNLEAYRTRLKADHESYARKARQLFDGIVDPPAGLPLAARSDADGKFSVMVDKADWLCIRAARQMPRENYTWLLPVSELGLDGDVTLFSNHNLYQPH